MRISVNPKTYAQGDAVKIVPWMTRLYQRHAAKTGVVKAIEGGVAKVKFDRTEVPVALEHLEKAPPASNLASRVA